MNALTSLTEIPNRELFDQHIKDSNLFSSRVTNALVRHGIITPRILVMHTRDLLHSETVSLGVQGLKEIEDVLAKHEWSFASHVDDKNVILTCLLAVAFYNISPLSLEALVKRVNRFSHLKWTAESIARAVKDHPYISQLQDGDYSFQIHRVIASSQTQPHMQFEQKDSINSPKSSSQEEAVSISQLWSMWLSCLSEREHQIIFSCYGIHGEDPATLQDVGNELQLTRERVRQLRERAINKLRAHRTALRIMAQYLLDAVLQANHLLTAKQWEDYLDKRGAWRTDEPRPSTLYLLCDVIRGFHYISSYHIVTTRQIKREHLTKLSSIVKHILRPHRKNGLTADGLATEIKHKLSPEFPDVVRDHSFILKAVDLFDRVGIKGDGNYFYLKNRVKTRYPSVGSGWAGKPGTRLYNWEMRLREQFNGIAWIGQLRLIDEDFQDMCSAIRSEAREPNYFSKVLEGQPLLVPPAVFLTTMVLAARYIENDANDAADEFWHPYLHTVWGVEYTQAFYARCKKRFNAVTTFLEETYGFEFPRSSKAQSDVITPIYRHALIPKYMQNDFAKWLYENWQSILAAAETLTLLKTALQTDKSLEHYSQRLGHFIRDEATAETAVSLITSMATAISLHIDDKEPIDSISELLADTPIEQELWQEISANFSEPNGTLRSTRLSKPRVTWVWLLDEGELCLRVQNITLSTENKLEGRPDRLVLLKKSSDDPLTAEVEVEVVPWHMKTGEYIIQDVFLKEPDSLPCGSIVLLTDLDEVAVQLNVPPHPTAPIQFYCITQQGAIGIPIDASQVTDGEILICAEQPVSFIDADGDTIEIDSELPTPYPLSDRYGWAAQVTLSLPSQVQLNEEIRITLEQKSSQLLIGQVSINGAMPISGLSPQIQSTFADTNIFLTAELNGERLLKQASLWLNGHSGWRCQHSLTELHHQGHISLADGNLSVNLSKILPLQPDLYTIELRSSLQTILPVPLQFAVIPDLTVEILSEESLYTPVRPFQVILSGISESTIARSSKIMVEVIADKSQQITWKELRYEPQLLLQFGSVEISLVWSVPRFTAWLEPKPTKPYLSLNELYESTLHVVCSDLHTDRFTLFVSDQYRTYSLKRGRNTFKLGQSQIYDVIRSSHNQTVYVKIQTVSDQWQLLEVQRYPKLFLTKVDYDEYEKLISLYLAAQEEWQGRYRFLLENLTNPLAPLIEVGHTNSLKSVHRFPTVLSDGTYEFQVELNGTRIALENEPIRFKVGNSSNSLVSSNQLAREMRTGQLISHNLAEDFVLNLVEVAETGDIELSPSLLFQLVTIPNLALENVSPNHVAKVWHPLAVIKAVHNQLDWIEARGLLPAWILLPKPVILVTSDHGAQLRVYPIEVLQEGRVGKGYGRWPMSTDESAPKEFVYVEWQPASDTEVQVEAGLPDTIPVDWSKIDLLDTYGLHYCPRCGRLTGVKNYSLSKEIIQAHLHGHMSSELRDITQPKEHGGYSLLAKFYIDRKVDLLQDIYQNFEVSFPSASSYLPEPSLPSHHLLALALMRAHLTLAVREIMQYGPDRGEASPWASAVRLLNRWQLNENISELGQLSFVLGMLVRSAAYDREQFFNLLTKMQLAESTIANLLVDLNKVSPAHLEWGITWAELIILHSPGKIYKENRQ